MDFWYQDTNNYQALDPHGILFFPLWKLQKSPKFPWPPEETSSRDGAEAPKLVGEIGIPTKIYKVGPYDRYK